MALQKLDTKEIETLIEALEHWENANFAPKFIKVAVKDFLKEIAPEEVQKDFDEQCLKSDQLKIERKETSLLLKAKLIQMKQNIIIKDTNKILKDNTSRTKTTK